MKNKSIWLDGIKFDKPKKLKNDIDIDVLIIGGGITGLSTAYHLIDSNLKVCVVERNLIAHGVTSKTTGKLTYLQENIYSKLKDKALLHYQSQKDAIKIVEDIINKNNINCDYKKVESYIYTDKDINKIKKEQDMLDKLNIKYQKHNNIGINVNCNYAISVNDTAVFHPIKYLKELKSIIVNNGIDVYEMTNVISTEKKNDKYICKTNNNIITCTKVVVASHYPFFLLPLFLPIRAYIEKSYISASTVNNTKPISAITVSKPITSIRYHEDKEKYLIYLNGSHNLCNKYNYKENFDYLINDIKNLGITPEYIWSNEDIMTEDNLPYIGFIDDNLLIGTGYNTWGMTNGSLAGKIISDLILKKENKYKNLFDPKRNQNVTNILKYPIHMTYNVKSFSLNKIIKNKSWYKSNIKFTKINDKNVAIYIDDNNKEHIVYNLCPHLKCSLIFNEIEKTWDCPCHASRFDVDGNCICGPSNQNIKFKN